MTTKAPPIARHFTSNRSLLGAPRGRNHFPGFDVSWTCWRCWERGIQSWPTSDHARESQDRPNTPVNDKPSGVGEAPSHPLLPFINIKHDTQLASKRRCHRVTGEVRNLPTNRKQPGLLEDAESVGPPRKVAKVSNVQSLELVVSEMHRKWYPHSISENSAGDRMSGPSWSEYTGCWNSPRIPFI